MFYQKYISAFSLRKGRVYNISKSFLLVFSSAFLFFFSNPNFFITECCPYTAWVCFVPLFYLLLTDFVQYLFILGFMWAFLSYSFIFYWLCNYSLQAYLFVCVLYSLYYAIAVYISACVLKQRGLLYGCFIAPAIFCLFDYLRTVGPLGFSYAIIGLSQWQQIPLIQNASLFGVWAITFFIYSVNFFIAILLKKGLFDFRFSFWTYFICICAFFVISNCLSYHYLKTKKLCKQIDVVLVQSNSDPWRGGVEYYKKDVKLLKKLTDEALLNEDNVDLVVWPESAVVPDILYYLNDLSDIDRFFIANDVVDYIKQSDCSFLIGNNYKNFNSALYFDNNDKSNIQIYNKNHLVPFTEKQPFLYRFKVVQDIYRKLDVHFFSSGKDISVFNIEGINVVTPICFEDSDSSLIRKMRNAGADIIVNLTNDSWSKSIPCQIQHLQCAVFRSVENRIATVRSTVNGKTCAIDETGKVLKKIDSGESSVLYITIYTGKDGDGKTFYDRCGDIFIYILLLISISSQIYICCFKKKR